MDDFSTIEGILIFACIVLLLLPRRYDPAIRIKDWQIKHGWHSESRPVSTKDKSDEV